LILNSDKSILQISKDLDVSDKTLYAWLRAYREKHDIATPSQQSKESLEEENRRLRKELAQVKKEREILKKAAAYFASEAQ
jgi:transposase